MAFSYQDVQNLGSVKAQEVKGSTKAAFNTVADSAKSAGTKAYEGVKGVMPVTNNKFGSLVDEVHANYNELDSRVWDLEFQVQLLAKANGNALPDPEAMKEIRRRWEEQQAEEARLAAEAEAKAKEEENKEPLAGETLVDVLTDPRVVGRLKALLFGTEKEVKEELQKEEPMLEDTAALDQYMEESPAVEEEAPAVKKDKVAGEWKSCVSCGTDISVVYKPDLCPHCKRTAESEEMKATGAPRPRIRFEG